MGTSNDSPQDPVSEKTAVAATDLELQKLSLEREKLDFERLRFTAEQAKRDKEIEKIVEEIREYKRPLWRKSSSLGAIATIGVATLAGILTFGTDVFKSNIRTLVIDRSRLKKTVASLTYEENKLKANTELLQQQTANLTREKQELSQNQAALVLQRDALREGTNALRSQKSKLEKDVLLAPIQTRISLLEPGDGVDYLALGYPSDASIQSLADYVTAHHNDAQVVNLLEQSCLGASRDSTRAAIALVLFRATGKARWKEVIASAALDSLKGGIVTTLSFFANGNLPYFLRLMNYEGLFSDDEKSSILRDLYHQVSETERQTSPNSGTTEPDNGDAKLKQDWESLRNLETTSHICDLAKWNKSATITFREPWLVCHKRLVRELAEQLRTRGDKYVGFGLYEFSPETYGIALLKETQILGTSYFMDGETAEPDLIVGASEKCPGFDESFPLCADWIARKGTSPVNANLELRIWHSSFSKYGSWLSENSELVDALLDPNHKVLSRVNDNTMGKLFDGVWITKSDLVAK